MNTRSNLLFVLSIFLVGCGHSGDSGFDVGRSASRAGSSSSEIAGKPAGDIASGSLNESDSEDAISKSVNTAADRKIIYTATVELVVQDLKSVDERIKRLIRASSGFLSEFREDRTYGDRLRGHWVVRIPTDQFESFLSDVVDLGVPENRQINAQDVTEEYVDLDRRLANKKRLEERILKLLDEQTGEIKDVIEVETQLARVREDIERMEGRLLYLKERVALTTITITAREEKDYTPPQAPRFVSQIQSTFSGSIGSIVRFSKGIVLFVVALAPWLVILSFLVVPTVMLIRRRRKPRGLH